MIVLDIDLPEYGLLRGDIGNVVKQAGGKVEVEFVTLKGDPVARVTLDSGQVRAVGEREIARAREVGVNSSFPRKWGSSAEGRRGGEMAGGRWG